MKKIRVGILGTASIAIRFIAPTLKSHPQFELIGFSSRSKERGIEISKRFECTYLGPYDQAVSNSNIDLIYIPLPNSLHYPWVIKSLENEKHVICEKSIGINHNEVVKMVNKAIHHKKLLVESFQFRFHSQHKTVKSWLNQGKIGEIRSFRSSFGFPPLKNKIDIRYQRKLGGGALLDAGAYTIKAASFILGHELTVDSSNLYTSQDHDVDIYGGASLASKTDIFAHIAFGFDNFYQCNYELWGSLGKLSVNRAFTAGPQITPTINHESTEGIKIIELPKDDHFYNLFTHVNNCIIEENFEAEYKEILVQSRLMREFRQKNNNS